MMRFDKTIKIATSCLAVTLISGASVDVPDGSPAFPATSQATVNKTPVPIADLAASETKQADPVDLVQTGEDEIEPLPVRPASTGKSENLFVGHSWYEPPPPPPQTRAIVSSVRREPTAPPLPYELLGTYEQSGSATLYFLVKGDRVIDVTIGDILEDTYSVDGIIGDKLMFTYLPLNTSQGLRLGEE